MCSRDKHDYDDDVAVMRRIDTIVLHHSASRSETHTWEEIRRWHLAKDPPWDDIGYHYGVCNDYGAWVIKLGRPEDLPGAHAKGFNADTIGVCVEGNYETDPFPWPAQTLIEALVESLCRRYNLPATAVVGHRELPYATLCPGKNFPLDAIRSTLTARLAQE